MTGTDRGTNEPGRGDAIEGSTDAAEDSTDAAALGQAATWRPMAFGMRPAPLIADALFEPYWPGRRVLVDVSPRGVGIRDTELMALPGGETLRTAIAAASRAAELVLDGYVGPTPLDRSDVSPDGRHGAGGITMARIVRQSVLGGLGSAPARPRDAAVADGRPLPLDRPLGFVAVDLLWLDGAALLQVPLGERKRLLEAVVEEAELVHRSLAVRGPAERWYGQWRSAGFSEVAVKAANSRYVPGGVSDDWTILRIPLP